MAQVKGNSLQATRLSDEQCLDLGRQPDRLQRQCLDIGCDIGHASHILESRILFFLFFGGGDFETRKPTIAGQVLKLAYVLTDIRN
jgi:hypothetical protein